MESPLNVQIAWAEHNNGSMKHKRRCEKRNAGELAEELRSAGHDVVRVHVHGLRRADDSQILAMAIAQQRVPITPDAHFGDWAAQPLTNP